MPPLHLPTQTLIFEHIPPSLHRPTAAPIVGPLRLPLTGENAQPTPSPSHMLLAAGSPAGTPRPPTFCLAGTPLNPSLFHTHIHLHTHDDSTSLLKIYELKDNSKFVSDFVVLANVPLRNNNIALSDLIAEIFECNDTAKIATQLL